MNEEYEAARAKTSRTKGKQWCVSLSGVSGYMLVLWVYVFDVAGDASVLWWLLVRAAALLLGFWLMLVGCNEIHLFGWPVIVFSVGIGLIGWIFTGRWGFPAIWLIVAGTSCLLRKPRKL